ncbi:MAG: hypothetical protein ACTSXG_04235 [Alphaproteobacteria bacterium]
MRFKRRPQLFVPHVSALVLAGVIILGEFHGYNSGYGLNNKLLRKLFEESPIQRVTV